MSDIELYNEEVRQWGLTLRSQITSNASKYGIRHRNNSPSPNSSVNDIKVKFRMADGQISGISIGLRRSLIYPHKGAGKGYAGVKGSRWIDKYGTRKSTDPDSLGKAGTGSRREKPFINDALEGPYGVEELADIVAERLATTIVNRAIIQ